GRHCRSGGHRRNRSGVGDPGHPTAAPVVRGDPGRAPRDGGTPVVPGQCQRDRHRRKSGLEAPPLAVTMLKVSVMAAAGIALVLVCNTDRGVLVPLKGVPYVVLVVLGFLAVWTFILGRTRFGRS